MKKILFALVVSFCTLGCQAATIPYGNLDTNTFQYGSSTNPGVVYFAYWTNVFNSPTLDTSPNTRVPLVSLGLQRPYYYIDATNLQAELNLYINGGASGLSPGSITWNAGFPGSNTVFLADPTNGITLKTSTTNRFHVLPNGVWEFGNSNSVNSPVPGSRHSRFSFYGQENETRVARFANGTNPIASIAFGPTNVDGVGSVGAWGSSVLGGMLSTWGINSVTTNNWASGSAGTNFYVGAVALSATPASMLGSDLTGAVIPIALANGVIPTFSGSNLVASALAGNATGTTNTGVLSVTGAQTNNSTIAMAPRTSSSSTVSPALFRLVDDGILTSDTALTIDMGNDVVYAGAGGAVSFSFITGGGKVNSPNGYLSLSTPNFAQALTIPNSNGGMLTNNGGWIVIGAQTNASTMGVKGATWFSTNITAETLSGSGSRAVVADANGLLSAPVSDETWKENIRPLEESYGIETVMKLNPIRFNYLDKSRFGKQDYLGFGARETAKIAPEVTGQMSDGTFYLTDEKITAILVKSAQQQQGQIQLLKISALLNVLGLVGFAIWRRR